MQTRDAELKLYRGKYYIFWYEGKTRRRISTGTADKKRARQAIIDFEQARQDSPRNEITLEDSLERYIESRRGKVQAFSRLAEAALRLAEYMGYLRIDQVNQYIWDDYVAHRFKKNAKNGDLVRVSNGTLRREYNVLMATLRRAWKDKHLHHPPEIEAPRDSAPRDRYLTKDEARRLIDACETPHVKLFVALAIYTGARKGSILALTWERVNFEAGLIDFQEPGRPLTAKRRAIVPMTRALQLELAEAYRFRDGPYVIQWHGKPVPKGLRWSFRKAVARAGLTWMPTPHHMKHSLASWFAMDGVSIDQTADWLATDPQTLRRVYRKFDPTYLRSIADDFVL